MGLKFYKLITFRWFVEPPINMELDNSTTPNVYCLCPLQHIDSNVNFIQNETRPEGAIFPVSSFVFPKSDLYTFHIYELTLNREFNFSRSVVVNGTDYSFSKFYHSYSGFSDFSVVTSS